MTRTRHLEAVPDAPLLPPTPADRLRANIGRRDALAREIATVDAAIAADARIYADERGEYLRPTIDDLRKRLNGDAA